ncbi:MAG: RagB/SusD family nutrient uptake outer membrane protein [Bacteroides sp.]|nr:RagB/SusD family nutrient uptake outer membrane protein [Bacteroides sp.]
MNKIQLIKAACLSLLSLFTVSCLDLEPKAQLGDNLVWNKADNFQLFANQFYSWTRDFQLSTTNTYGNGVSDGPHSDYRSDLIATSSINTYSQGTNVIPSEDANYTTLYKQIYYTNLLLSNAESFSDQAAIAVPVAEAKFFRAYCHFELVQIWGNAILLTEPLDLNSEQLYAARNDRGEVIDQIIIDLEEAAEALPETADAGRLTKYAAYAMLSRVALYEGTWQKFHTGGAESTTNTTRSSELLTVAKEAAQKVIDGGKYELFYNETLGSQSYRYMFILEDAAQCNPANLHKTDNPEYILSHRHRDGDKNTTNITHGMLANVCYITRKMANMYLCSNGLPIDKAGDVFKGYSGATTEFQNRDNRMANTMVQHEQKYWNNDGKWRISWNDEDLNNALVMDVRSNSGYQNYKWCVERQVADYYESIDYPVIRYAEVLLNYVEAVYELQGNISDTDLKYLNEVRTRVNPNMPELTNAFVSQHGLSMREEIRRERTVELFLEGFRIDDLKRWATAPKEMVEDQLGVKVTGTWFETNWAAQSRQLNADGCIILYDGRTWSDKLYLYPLPSDQLQLNPQLGQNPGWGNN